MSDFKECFGEDLLCPKCGSNYLKLTKIKVLARNGEDNKYGLNLNIDPQEAKFTCETDVCIPSRRDVTYLKFRCEICGTFSTLGFLQDKGITNIV
jgi:Zn finger protein HypA/HybF involved in hydrogenase expression